MRTRLYPVFLGTRRRWLAQVAALATSAALPTSLPRLWAQSPPALSTLPRLALVLGNTSYAEAPLRNPANDAKAIGSKLQALGFRVSLQLNAGRVQMVNAIQAFGSDLAKTRGVGLFYYAGHGAQLAWRNYLIPIDVAIDRLEDMREKAVDLNSLLQGLIAARNPMNVIILDACRDNPFGNKVLIDQRGLSQFDAPPGSLLAYATSPGNTAADGDGENGLYTESLLRELAVSEAKIEDVFKRVRLAVRRKSEGRQIPWESTSLEEDFYFLPPTESKTLKPDEQEKQFDAEFSIWEKIKTTKEVAPLEDYLSRYPSGKFSELAQFRLDKLLAQQESKSRVASSAPSTLSAASDSVRKLQEELTKAEAELKKVQRLAVDEARKNQPIIQVSIAPNPFSKGTGRANVEWQVGDSYTYRVMDSLTKIETRKFTHKVTGLTENEVFFNNGNRITDLLGNDLKTPNENLLTQGQFFPAEYAIGRKWSTTVRRKLRTRVGVREMDFRIVEREEITVPAGTFNAFRIEGRGFFDETNVMHTRTIWMAPDMVRRPIAYEITTSNKSGGLARILSERSELTAYNQSS